MFHRAKQVLLATALAGAMAGGVSAQTSAADEIARYRAMLQDGNPAELTVMRGEDLWKQKRGPKQASLEQCDIGLGPGVIKGAVPCGSPATDGWVPMAVGVRPAGPPFCTNRVTASASAAEPSGVAALPANCDAAASSNSCADDGIAAACWMTGLRFCTAARPGS
jgi:hypothetical protein